MYVIYNVGIDRERLRRIRPCVRSCVINSNIYKWRYILLKTR